MKEISLEMLEIKEIEAVVQYIQKHEMYVWLEVKHWNWIQPRYFIYNWLTERKQEILI